MDGYCATLLLMLFYYCGLASCWVSRIRSEAHFWTGNRGVSSKRQQPDRQILMLVTPSSAPLGVYDGDVIKEINDASVDASHHAHFMQLALKHAEMAKRKGEVPVGAVIVRRHSAKEDGANSDDVAVTYEVLAQAHNLVETRRDASAHAELLALRQAASKVRNWRLVNTTLYSTLEPCPMCLAAAQAFRVSSIVYGAPDLRLGAVQTHMRLLDDYQHPYHRIDTVVPGVMHDESASLLKAFFRERRMEKLISPSSQSQGNIRWRKLNGMLRGVLQGIFRLPR
jgi:tRNA(adenine34) deaminase